MASRMSCTLFPLLVAFNGLGIEQASGQPPKVELHEVVSVLELIVRPDPLLSEQFQRTSISLTNSQVVISTSGIRQVVEKGPEVIPVLLTIMKCKDVSFDTFVRCYTACDQILEERLVFWEGGVAMEKTLDGVTRFRRGEHMIDEDEKAFRAKVIRSIEEQLQHQMEE